MFYILFTDGSTNNMLHILFTDGSTSNSWFLSEFGSDDNDCRSEFTECKNLQTVLDRATDGADICVTSEMLLHARLQEGSRDRETLLREMEMLYERWRLLHPASSVSTVIHH